MSKYTLLSKEEHAQKSWKRASNYYHAQSEVLVQLLIKELPKAQQTLPIAFVKQNNNIVPAAVLGVANKKNLFVAPNNGRWVDSYIPAVIRAYPFKLAHAEGRGAMLAIDGASEQIVDEGGSSFFDENGLPSKDLEQVMSFLQSIEAGKKDTELACAELQKHGLLMKWDIQIELDDNTMSLNGLYRIDEEALSKLSAEALHSLQKSGALTLIYCHVFSVQNVAKLKTLLKLHTQAGLKLEEAEKALQNEKGELDLEFLNGNGTFSF
ncbi:SapC [Marinomonas aquimarina]|uniref:SapC n=1 Tax=Marinomonas aquimarina TaxID=295068 RepID=A0A1A8T1K6_9GAMM|nr:SapC family protein [Marinomonas aquimarina]SBS25833.1 SapC [Marinomonas aquimarina]